MSEKLPIQLRPANSEDINFIFSSWLKSFRGSPLARNVSNTVYFAEQHKLIEDLLRTSTVLVACNSDDPSQVYGWICATRIDGIFCLHYVYVKHSFRNLGIATLLLKAFERDNGSLGILTHFTKAAEKFSLKFNLLHHPYVLFRTYKQKDQE